MNKKQLDLLINNLNHKMTRIETDVKWLKKLIVYISGILTLSFIKTLMF